MGDQRGSRESDAGGAQARADEGGPLERAPLPVVVLRRIGIALLRLPRAAGALLALGWAGVIYLISGSSDPLPDAVPVPLFLNNLAHAPLFGFLAFLGLVALPRRERALGPDPWPRIDVGASIAILLPVLAYAVFDEWHQSWVPGRHASAGDVLTDVSGALAVLLVAHGLGAEARPGGALGRRLTAGATLCLAAAAVATWGIAQPA